MPFLRVFAPGVLALLVFQVASGDLSTGNVWLATQLLDVMLSYEQWLYEKPHLFTMALYTYLRLLADHTIGKSPILNDLKQKEIAFCTKVLRERFQDCLMIGRDLIRLLQDVALVPEFELIWRDLLSNPGAFKAPGFTDIGQLYVIRTPTRYLASRVTPDMETQIRFMLTSVRMGSQRRYQTWFAQRYLFTPESETLVCDLIRFICCAIHPTNQILQSDICPRWAIVGWLLKCCKSNHVEANAKLALFYDWLFFMKADNIMNIEPAILLTVHSIPKYVDMTNSLLEFLFLLVENYDPIRRDLILKGVTISIDILVGKGVVRSLEPLSASPLVSPALREKLNMYFPSYCKPDTGEGPRQFRAESLPMDGVQGGKGGGVVSYVPVGGDGQSSPGAAVVSETAGVNMDELKAGDVGDGANRKRRRTGSFFYARGSSLKNLCMRGVIIGESRQSD
jgi:integrator complex subunit 3